MPPTPQQESPKLDPPGAGLPKPELLIAGAIFRYRSWRSSRTKASKHFDLQTEQILQLVRSIDSESGSRRILIPRLAGLEDSSRFWSVFMTLDHLRIVNDAIGNVIRTLIAGQIPPTQASTAALKPSVQVNATIIEAFEKSCQSFEQTVAAAADLATTVRYAHPWFGPLDAARWHYLAGFHMALHCKQIQSILSRLPNKL